MRPLKQNPVLRVASELLIDSPLPSNLSYNWNFGSLLGLNLVIMIVSGVTLAMHYTPHVDLAFQSVEHIMRDVHSGWLIRLVHANGASIFFILTYLHVARGLYQGSYRSPRGALWAVGVVILILMMATAFLGYVLPWGGDTLAPDRSTTLSLRAPVGPLAPDFTAFLTGSLLGDGHIARHGPSARLEVKQGDRNIAYLHWLHRFLAERGWTSPTLPPLHSAVGPGNRITFYARSRTYASRLLLPLREDWTDPVTGRKRLPAELTLPPLTFAIWVQDDGGAHASGMTLSTQGFTVAEADRLAALLTATYGVPVHRWLRTAGPVLYLPKRSLETVRPLLLPHLVATMRYKVGLR